MSEQNNARRLQWEIALVIALKIVLLVLIWQFFFSANRVEVDARAMDEHMRFSPQGKYKQTQ